MTLNITYPLLCVGERRSNRAQQMNVHWEDRRLAAIPLFEAFERLGIDLAQVSFINWFEPDGPKTVHKHRGTVIALGKKVQTAMRVEGIEFISLIHPAARGKIRLRDAYCAHVREALSSKKETTK
jgi:hypothetical protein